MKLVLKGCNFFEPISDLHWAYILVLDLSTY